MMGWLPKAHGILHPCDASASLGVEMVYHNIFLAEASSLLTDQTWVGVYRMVQKCPSASVTASGDGEHLDDLSVGLLSNAHLLEKPCGGPRLDTP